MTDEEKTTLKYAFAAALLTAVAEKAIEFAYEEARDWLRRRREEREPKKDGEKSSETKGGGSSGG